MQTSVNAGSEMACEGLGEGCTAYGSAAGNEAWWWAEKRKRLGVFSAQASQHSEPVKLVY